MTVLAGLQVDFVCVDTYERSVKEYVCVLPFSQNAWLHCCHSTPVARIHHRHSNFFTFLHTSSYFIVLCCWQTTCMCDSGVLSYTTRAVLIADWWPTNKQYGAECRVPCWGHLGIDWCRASHLNVTGPRYCQLTRVTSTKGRVLTLCTRAFLPQGTQTLPTTRQQFWSQTPSWKFVGSIVLSWILPV